MDVTKIDELFERGELAYGSYCQPVIVEGETHYIFVNVSEHCDRFAWDRKTPTQKTEMLQSLVSKGIEEIESGKPY